MTTSLGSVLEPEEPTDGPSARLTVDVLESWLDAGRVLELVVPRRLACARCEGGGCDGCGRSGAIRVPGEEQERMVRVTLSESARALRLMRPLGVDAGLDQLIIELRPALVPSDFCRCVAGDGRRTAFVPLLVFIALVVMSIVALALRR